MIKFEFMSSPLRSIGRKKSGVLGFRGCFNLNFNHHWDCLQKIFQLETKESEKRGFEIQERNVGWVSL